MGATTTGAGIFVTQNGSGFSVVGSGGSGVLSQATTGANNGFFSAMGAALTGAGFYAGMGNGSTGPALFLDSNTGGTSLYIQSSDGSTSAISGAASGRLRYNNTTGHWEVSTQGGAYTALATAVSTTLQQDYTNGGAGGGAITITALGGPIALTTTGPTSGLTVTNTGGSGDCVYLTNNPGFNSGQPTLVMTGTISASGGPSFGVYDTTTFSDSGVASTTAVSMWHLAPTVNFTGPGTGSYEALTINVAESSAPSGPNYLIAARSGASGTTPRFTVDSLGNVSISGKLTVTGAIDPTSLSLSGGTALFIDSTDGSTAPIPAAGHGRMRYVQGTGWQFASDGIFASAYSTAVTMATIGGTAFLQSGNAFGATATLGTTDANNLSIITNGTACASFATSTGTFTVAPPVRTTGSPSCFVVTSPADTTLSAGVEAVSVNLNLSSTRQFSTGF